MGKSPGRWMKTLIFGKKKSPRSNNSRPNDELKKVDVLITQDQITELKTEENLQPDNSQHDVCISAPTEQNAQNDSDRIREEQAAIDLQAGLRGYLARRRLQTRKGIVRLQAVIRGHLVRRQAVSTLYCMFHIVKLQALARGTKIRKSNNGTQVPNKSKPLTRLVMGALGVNKGMQMLKLSSNGFAQKIVASSPKPMPLHFQYNSKEANSVLSWLERWSTSQCWHLLPNAKSGQQRSKPQNPHTLRSSVTSIASEFDKPIQNIRKFYTYQPEECIEEDPELVLERVKRNLRKVNGSVLHSTNDSFQQTITQQEKVRVSETETLIIKENGDDDENVKESNKSRRPLRMKQSLPSYMAATVSAKAKLRGQDGLENTNGLSRRYSLPAMTNANVSVSPLAKSTGKLKNDRSLQLSRDGDVSVKVNQIEWRW